MAREFDKITAAEHFSYGKVYLDQGEYQNAIEEFHRSLTLDPENANVLISLGRGYLSMRNFEEASKCFEKATEMAPEFADGHYYLGLTYLELNMKEKAINEFKESLNINPKYIAAKNAFGQLMRTVDRKTQDIENEPNSLLHSEDTNETKQANIHFHLGNALFQKHLHQEALMEYKEAVRLRPNYPEIRE
ncbi:MAG: tetratricopeptide repeat protein, partial [bacterium]